MKRIDIYTIDIGGGHIAPAEALKQQFDLMGYRDLDVRVVNLGIELRARFLRAIYKFYWRNALRYPPLINAFYRGADNPFLIQVVDRILGITILPRFVRYLEREKPDLVVSTYFTFTHYLELLKRVGQLDAVSVVLNPEPFDSHYIWFSPAFDWSLVFSQKSRDEIAEKGIPCRTVKVFHFPLKPSFAKRHESRSVLRRRLGLDLKTFTLLFFFGAEGVGPVKKYLAALAFRGLDLQAVVICGRNDRLRVDIESYARGGTAPVRVVVRGYVTNLADFIAAADVVVGKSGPNQVFETLLQERPIIISSFLANEKETTNWVLRNRLGWLTRTPANLALLVSRLVARPSVLEEYRRSIRRLKLRSGAPEICEFLYDQVKRKTAKKRGRVAEALRRLRDAVVAEGEALSKRLDPKGRLRRARGKSPAVNRPAAQRASEARGSARRNSARRTSAGRASTRHASARRVSPTSGPRRAPSGLPPA